MTDPTSAAAAIGDALCEAAIRHDGRCTWIGPRIDEGSRGRVAFAPVGGELYDGSSGIAVFLAELWRATGAQEYRRTALAAGRHAVMRMARSPRAGLHAGSVGIALGLRRVGEMLGSEELLTAVPAGVAMPVGPGTAATDLLTGIAGTALGLAVLPGDAEPATLARAVSLSEDVVRRSHHHRAVRSWPTIDGAHLLGLSHGAGGIALALAEVGHATGRGDLLDAAREGFAYERSQFVSDEGDWPDLRADPRGDDDVPTFRHAWCHGAPGIALTRLRGHEILGDRILRDEATAALTVTARAVEDAIEADGGDFCLCHGLAGNADVLLCAAEFLGEDGAAWADVAEHVAHAGVRRYHDLGDAWPSSWGSGCSPALMTGVAGIGLFLLRVADRSVETVLITRPPLQSRAPRSISSEEVASVH